MAYMSPMPPQFHLSNAAPPLPGTNWWSQPGSNGMSQPIRNIADLGMKQAYTNEKPREFWSQVGQQIGGGNLSWQNYWDSVYNQYYAQYLADVDAGGTANASPILFPDWVTGAVGDKALKGYHALAPEQRGIDPRKYDSGRFDTRF